MDNEMVLKDKFTDYAGVEHQFVVAVRKVNLKNYDSEFTHITSFDDDDEVI